MLNSLVNPKEEIYFVILAIGSVLVYLGLIVSLVGIVYIIFGAAAALVLNGLLVGNLRANGVRLSQQQFGEVYARAQQIAQEFGLLRMPDIYILQSGGVLNAFAARFLGRDFVVIYSDVFELALGQGPKAVDFVLAHELAHHARGHLRYRWLILPGLSVPFLGTAYMRACEYTCDRFAAHVVPDGAADGLLVLASGKRLFQHVDRQQFMQQAERGGFWCWMAEVLSTHPHLPKRLAAVSAASDR